MGKEEATLKKYNGFIWIETLVSLNIVLVVMTLIVPIYTSIEKEKQVLHEQSLISLGLFNEFQTVLHERQIDKSTMYQEKINDRQVTYQFTSEGVFLKGCVNWENAKQKQEKRCLYGIPNE